MEQLPETRPEIITLDTEAVRASSKKTLSEAVAALPPGVKGAVLLDATEMGKTSVILVSKIIDKDNFGWMVMAEGDFDPNDRRHVSGRISTAITWK